MENKGKDSKDGRKILVNLNFVLNVMSRNRVRWVGSELRQLY